MRPRSARRAAALGATLLLTACATRDQTRAPAPRPADVRARIAQLLPANLSDRAGWAADFHTAFAAQQIEPSTQNLCAALAVTEQESNFQADPAVPNLGRIARAEIDRRAAAHHVPRVVVSAALLLPSPDGRRYGERLEAVRTERELSQLFEDMIGELPLGRRLFADANPVRTGGPMQVAVAFAEQHVRDHRYPYPLESSLRHAVFTRRGGVYFGVAHLLDYPVSYTQPIYRFADFNAGRYASRNAAFQQALASASGVKLALDGDLVAHDGDGVGATERAARSLAGRIDLSDAQIRRALERGDRLDFEETALYARVFELADARAGKSLPRAMLPQIALHSAKFTRPLTTAWFAQRVQQRYERCLKRAQPPAPQNPQG